jgi:hypothetical protein
MAWKTFDFLCTNEKCVNYMVKVERMVKDSEKDSQVCESCGNILNLGFGSSAIKTSDNQGRIKV